MADRKLDEKDLKKVTKQLEEIREFIGELEDAGIEVPPSLTKALEGLQVALDTSEDLGSAFEEASGALATFNKGLLDACKKVDAEMQGVCEAQVLRKWQHRNIQFTLDYKNPDSVTSKFLQKTVRRYTPEAICKHWDYCSKHADD